MIELSLNGIEKYYGATKVLNNITFEVNTEEKIGLIGGNGAGKTTIFKIISGIEEYDNGIMAIRKGATVGYLDQIPDYPDDYKVIDVLNTAFKKIFEIKMDMKKLEEKMNVAKEEELEKVIKKYGEVQSIFEHKGGYDIEEKVNRICVGLKLDEDFINQKFSTLSGGEKTTVVLGKILLQNPDILLLDEPSNHLDIESIEWLESFLSEYEGTVLIISHDRYFLDRVVKRIVEIESGETNEYLGNYSYYVDEKKRRLLEQYEAYKNQQKKIKDMENAIKRFRDWGTRADNKSMFVKARNMEKRIERIEKVDRPVLEKRKIQLDFTGSERSGKDVIRIEGLKKSFGEDIVLENLDLHVRFKERLGILGKNGSGKSTLIKIILKQYDFDGGEVEIGSRVKIGYLQQNVTFVNEDYTVIGTFVDAFPMTEGKARGLLAKFLFRDEDVFKKVKNLSGGEKTRLKLCLLMYRDLNTLILDEPTNHLDIESREMLEEALCDFNGTIIFISHDRYFVNKIANRIIEVENKKTVNYIGGYDFYKREKEKQKSIIEEKVVVKKEKKKEKRNKPNPQNEGKKKAKRILTLEEDIQKFEELIKEKDNEMESNASDHQKINELYNEKQELQNKLDVVLEEWMELSE